MKIKLKIELADGKTVELTEDKARELHQKLDEYFGRKEGWYPTWVYPYWRDWQPAYQPVTTTYGATDRTTTTSKYDYEIVDFEMIAC